MKTKNDYPLINLKDITVRIKGKIILKSFDIQLNPGQCGAIIGPNGAGKSTLISVMAGYLWPSEGTVEVLGKKFGQTELAKLRSRIGLISNSRIPGFNKHLTAREIVATGLFGSIMLPASRDLTDSEWANADRKIKQLGLKEMASREYGTLSTGEQMKCLIARAIASSPELLILDEPTAGLDLKARAETLQMLSNLENCKNAPGILVVSHHLEELPYHVDKVILMKDGKNSYSGKPDQVLTNEKLSSVFSCKVNVVKDNGRFFAEKSCRD